MVNLATFSAPTFNALPGPYVPAKRDEHVRALLAIIGAHGMSQSLGVSLNHSHFDVSNDKPVTITKMDETNGAIHLQPTDAGKSLPYMFHFVGNSIAPLQFIAAELASDSVAGLSRSMGDPKSRVSALLDAFNAYLLEHEVQREFGIIINVVSGFTLTRAVSLGESTHRDAAGQPFQTFVMQSVEQMDGDLQTQWYRNSNDDDQPLHCFCSGGGQMRCHK